MKKDRKNWVKPTLVCLSIDSTAGTMLGNKGVVGGPAEDHIAAAVHATLTNPNCSFPATQTNFGVPSSFTDGAPTFACNIGPS